MLRPKHSGQVWNFVRSAKPDFMLVLSPQAWRDIGKQSGVVALRATVKLIRDLAAVRLRKALELSKHDGIEGLVIDQVLVAGGTIADRLEHPFVTPCSATFLTRWSRSPAVTGWRYDPPWGRSRNALGYPVFNAS